MALIKCSECGKEFSDKASACPNCGCPTSEMVESPIVEDKKDNLDAIWKTVPEKKQLISQTTYHSKSKCCQN